jgi:hypothetical protein
VWTAAGCLPEAQVRPERDAAAHWVTRARGSRIVQAAFAPTADVLVVLCWDGAVGLYARVRGWRYMP